MSQDGSVVRLELAGETAMACYLLMANWPIGLAAPTVDTASRPMMLSFELESLAGLDSILASLRRAILAGGAIGKSAAALSAILEDKIKGLEMPHGARDHQSSENAS